LSNAVTISREKVEKSSNALTISTEKVTKLSNALTISAEKVSYFSRIFPEMSDFFDVKGIEVRS